MSESSRSASRATPNGSTRSSVFATGWAIRKIGRFANHEGYDGVFLALPGTGAHLEFTSGPGHEPPEPHPETLPFSTSEAGRTRGQTPFIKWNG